MNFIKFKVFCVMLAMFIFVPFIFAEDLEIESGKNLLFGWVNSTGTATVVDQDKEKTENFTNPKTWPQWYDTNVVYDNVNIGAATKVVLDNAWEYVFESSSTEVETSYREVTTYDETDPTHIIATTSTVKDETHKNTYNYCLRERIATLSVDKNGTITLNNGSELSIKNQYSLITSTGDVSLKYKSSVSEGSEIIVIDTAAISSNAALEYTTRGENNEIVESTLNMKVDDTPLELFTGDIIFGVGATDTILTFANVSNKTMKGGIGEIVPTATKEWGIEDTISGGKKSYIDTIEEEAIQPSGKNDVVTMENNFIINSNRAVFNVELSYDKEKIWNLAGSKVELNSSLSGDGMVVKDGQGFLSLLGTDATGLTGKNTGFGFSIENGIVVASKQTNLGNANIYIAKNGILGLVSLMGVANTLTNDITINSGVISIGNDCEVVLKGDLIGATDDSYAQIQLYYNSDLKLEGNGSKVKNYNIGYGSLSGGYSNYLTTGVDGLASESVYAQNTTAEEYKDASFFELILNENEDKSYSGSLQGEMYLRKTGSGLVILSGENTYTKGTYITEGGLLLATSKSIGEGKIIFDGGVSMDTTTYATIGVSSATSVVEIGNDIHIKNGAIFNVFENQTLCLGGSIESIDPTDYTEVMKDGLGTAILVKGEGTSMESNIDKFTITEGGFVLDEEVVLDSEFSLDGNKAFLEMREGAGIKNNEINIENGDLIIFNEQNVSLATAVNFNNVSTSTESFSKLHISSNAAFSTPNLINIAKNIEFVIDATTTAKMDSFNFISGADSTIVKSGEGTFVADGDGDFDLENLYVNAGVLTLDNTDMSVSSKTIIDGGILKISSTSSFASTAVAEEDKKITVLDGGIGIYDDSSVDSDTLLSFEGTDEKNLSKLIVEAADVNLTNDIYVKTGVMIENENDLTFSGESITYDPSSAGILAKSGAGTMTIDPTKTFEMGEIRALEGNLVVKSDINVSTISISGKNAVMSIEGGTSNISDLLSIENNGWLEISTATLNANVIDLISSSMILVNEESIVNSSNVNVKSGSLVSGCGEINAIIDMQKGSSMVIGRNDDFTELEVGNITFESGSNLYVDITSDEYAEETSDKLVIDGDITVQKDVKLYVNMLGSESGYDAGLNFEIMNFAGNSTFENSTNEIFDIVLSSSRFSASTSLIGKSIFLNIAQEFSLYELPGATKNQSSMITALNDIYKDPKAYEVLKNTLKTMDGIYSEYLRTGSSVEFVNALQDLSGIFYANSFMASAMLANSKTNIVYNRLDKSIKESENENNVWAQVYTNKFTVSKNEENPEFENNIYGMIAGYDTVYDDKTIVGFSAFYGQGEMKQLEDKADVVDAGANIYANYKANNNIDIRGLIGYSVQDFDTTRKLRFINNKEMKAKYVAKTASFDLEASYRFDLSDSVALKPILGANCEVVANGDIEEDGTSEQRLKIKENTYTRAAAKVGFGLQGRQVSPFNWHLSAFAKQILVGEQFKTKACFADIENYNFEIESTKLPVTSFVGNIGCSYDISSAVCLSLDLNADTGSSTMFGGNIGATYRW